MTGWSAAGWTLHVSLFVLAAALAGACVWWLLTPRAPDRGRRHAHAAAGYARDLPFVCDMLVIALSAGLSLSAAIELVIAHAGPGPLRDALTQVPARVRSGMSFRDAFRSLAQDCDCRPVDTFVSCCNAAQATGSDLADNLRELSMQYRDEFYFEAERRAMQAPVRMLPALLVFIFPCTFLVLLFPIAMRLVQEGIL